MRAVRDNIDAARDAVERAIAQDDGNRLAQPNRQDLGGIDERLRPRTTSLGVHVEAIGGFEKHRLSGLEQPQLVRSQDDRRKQRPQRSP